MNSRAQRLLLIHPGPKSKADLLADIASRELELFVACEKSSNWVREIIPESHIITTHPLQSVPLLCDVAAFMTRHGISFSGVGTFWEHAVTQAADVARALSLHGVDPGGARRSSCNKILMRRACQLASVSPVEYDVADDVQQLELAVRKLGLPCVLKPVFGNNSQGVYKLDDLSELGSAVESLERSCSALHEPAFRQLTGTFLVERFISGPLVSVDGFVQGGRVEIIGMVETDLGPEPWFTHRANHVPPRISDGDVDACHALTRAIVATIGLDHCPFHCELRIGPEGPSLIEIAARMPGGAIPSAYRLAYGVDFVSIALDIWCGRQVTITRAPGRTVLQKGIFPDGLGVLASLRGLEDARRLRGVCSVEEVTKVGSAAQTYPEVPVPIYFYTAVAASHAELALIEQKIESCVQWSVNP